MPAEWAPSLIIRAIEGRRHGCCVVNGFVNETWRNRQDSVKRAAMAGTATIVTCAFKTGEATRDSDRLAHNPEVAVSNPVPATSKMA